jgi:integrase
VQRLTIKQVANSKPGRVDDKGGTGLILETSPTLRRRWLIRFSRPNGGGVTEATLGQFPYVTLSEAREKAFDFRRRLSQGLSPVTPKHVTYMSIESDVLSYRSQSAKNPPLALRAGKGLLRYIKPLHDLSVASITTDQVLGVLLPIWTTKPTVAKRVRVLVESTLDAGHVRGLRSADNVARWKGHLAHVLPAPPTLTRGHHKALAYADVPNLMRRLAQIDSTAARCMRLTILCALRKNETMNARWSDLSSNGEGAVLIVPPERMKGGREFRIPMSSGALAVIEEQRAQGLLGDLIFPSGIKIGQPMNGTTPNDLLNRLGTMATPHGIARSSFRDYIADCTEFPRDLAEMCLGHVVSGVEGAYRRSDMLERRRAIMKAWSNFIVGP